MWIDSEIKSGIGIIKLGEKNKYRISLILYNQLGLRIIFYKKIDFGPWKLDMKTAYTVRPISFETVPRKCFIGSIFWYNAYFW